MADPAVQDWVRIEQRRLGARLRTLREARGWSQDTLAHLSGLNRSYPHKIERGELDLRYSTLLRLAAALDISVADLIGQTQTPMTSDEASTPDQQDRARAPSSD